jgi:hypothetical protein
VKPIKDGDPRYSLAQDLIEGDAETQSAAVARLDKINLLIKNGEEVADHLTTLLIPEDLRAAGYRFTFDTTPISVHVRHHTDH